VRPERKWFSSLIVPSTDIERKKEEGKGKELSFVPPKREGEPSHILHKKIAAPANLPKRGSGRNRETHYITAEKRRSSQK